MPQHAVAVDLYPNGEGFFWEGGRNFLATSWAKFWWNRRLLKVVDARAPVADRFAGAAWGVRASRTPAGVLFGPEDTPAPICLQCMVLNEREGAVCLQALLRQG